MSPDDIARIVAELGDLAAVLASADAAQKADVHGLLGLKLTYRPAEATVTAEARPADPMYVRKCPRGECTQKPMCADG